MWFLGWSRGDYYQREGWNLLRALAGLTRNLISRPLRAVWLSIPAYLTFYVFLAVILYAGLKGLRQATVISPFRVPPESSLPFSGDMVANAIADALARIRTDAERELRSRSGELIGPEEKLARLKLPDLSGFEVPTRFTVEVRGLSHEALISLGRKVWGRERLITGDVFLAPINMESKTANKGEGEQSCARLSISPNRGEKVQDCMGLVARTPGYKPWASNSYEQSAAGLKLAADDLAFEILQSLDPTTLAAQDIAQDDLESAYRRLEFVMPAEDETTRFLFGISAGLYTMRLSGQGQYESAIQILTKTRNLIGENAFLSYAEGVVHYNGHYAEATESFWKALQFEPKSPIALRLLGKALQEKGPFDAAIASYRRADKLKPNDPEILSSLGNAQFYNGQFDEAFKSLTRAKELKPNDPEILSSLGDALLLKGDYGSAVMIYKRIAELKQNSLGTLRDLGDAFAREGNLSEAIASFKKALELDPQNSGTYFLLGSAFAMNGQPRDAIDQYERAVEIDPSFADAYINMGIAQRESDQLDPAIASFKKALDKEPNNVSALNNLAFCWNLKRDHEKALNFVHEALRIESDNPGALDTWAVVLRSKGSYDKAMSIHREAIKNGPHIAEAHRNFAITLRQSGRDEEAQKHFAEAQRLDPSLKPPEE